jgi:hypothetical protein
MVQVYSLTDWAHILGQLMEQETGRMIPDIELQSHSQEICSALLG